MIFVPKRACCQPSPGSPVPGAPEPWPDHELAEAQALRIQITLHQWRSMIPIACRRGGVYHHLSSSLKSCMGLLTGQCWPRPWSRARIAASVRVATLSLAKMVEVLLLTVLSESPRLDAMAELE